MKPRIKTKEALDIQLRPQTGSASMNSQAIIFISLGN